ncbi:MAG: hypothetical protein ABEI57_01650 [Halapricum sp.]
MLADDRVVALELPADERARPAPVAVVADERREEGYSSKRDRPSPN